MGETGPKERPEDPGASVPRPGSAADVPEVRRRARILAAGGEAVAASRHLEPRYAVEARAEAAGAAARAREAPPDLVLADAGGRGLLQELRRDERTRGVPVILLAGGSGEGSGVDGLTWGADDVIVRPFQPKDLLARVASRLRLERTRKEREMEMRQQNASLERKVEERTRELSAALREIESFAYTVAHDLRAPVRAMAGFSHALLDECGERLGEEGRDYARRILEAGRRMDAMIRDLLDYSRLGRERIELKETDLEDLVEEVLAEMAPELRERRAAVEVLRPLPRVRAHPLTLRRALSNLVSNAVKFTAAGVEPRVRLRAERDGAATRLWVEDNGIGIAPEYHDRIFGVFERLHGTTAYPGTGIGLAIVRKAMERMGGSAGVRSEAGKGSRFHLQFPAAEPEDVALPVKAEAGRL